MTATAVYLGADVAKDAIVFDLLGHSFTISNAPRGFAALLKRLRSLPLLDGCHLHVICEPTGGFQDALAAFLHQQHMALSVVDARQAHDFARCINHLAKNDKLDARLLSHYGRRIQPAPDLPPAPYQQELADLLAHRQFLVDNRAQEKTRVQMPSALRTLRPAIKKHIAFLTREIKAVEIRLKALQRSHASLHAKVMCLEQTRGVAWLGAITLIGRLPELGTDLDRNEIAALAGLAPFACDSGKFHGKRSIAHGRASVRCQLYMSALSASRFNPVLRAFYLQLINRGKAKKLALIAVARKLLIHLNSQLKNLSLSTC